MAQHQSWLDRALDLVAHQTEAPPRPHAPSASRSRSWQESVDRHHVVPGLTVRDVGLSVFGETKSLRNRRGSNEPIDSARQKVAHMIINGAEKWGPDRIKYASTAPPKEPSEEERRNPVAVAAYESSMRAAREAYLSGHDPTNGATHFNLRPTPDRTNWKGRFPISTQSGPYDNSFPSTNAPRHTTWLNTYLPDQKENKQNRKP